jgi:fatty acid desaturase
MIRIRTARHSATGNRRAIRSLNKDAPMTDTSTQTAPTTLSDRITIRDVDLPFGRLVMLFVKMGLAAIPALIILMLTFGIVGALLRGLFRLGHMGGGYGW